MPLVVSKRRIRYNTAGNARAIQTGAARRDADGGLKLIPLQKKLLGRKALIYMREEAESTRAADMSSASRFLFSYFLTYS